MPSAEPVHVYARHASYGEYSIDLGKVYYQRILAEIRARAPRGGKILDIGCFDGTLVSQLAPAWEPYGLEGNVQACQEAARKGVQASNHDLDKTFPFESGLFNAVIAAEIIEHVYDTDFFLQEIHRVLKPGGILVLTTPNIACLANRVGLLFGRYPRYAEYQAGGAGHIRVYTSPVIRDQVRNNGFDVLKYAGCNLPLPMHSKWIPSFMKKMAVWGGDYFPGLAGQVVITARKK